MMSVLVLKELRGQRKKQACKSQHDSRGRGGSLGPAWPVGFTGGEGQGRNQPRGESNEEGALASNNHCSQFGGTARTKYVVGQLDSKDQGRVIRGNRFKR